MALNLKDFRFLVVDDLREMRMTLRGMLEALKVGQIAEAKNTDEALDVLGTQQIDVVLCDYNLNETRDGQQLFDEARGRGLLLPHAAWIMITAEQTMGMVMGVVENNPDGYLVKPINKAVLQTRIERAVARRMITREIETALRGNRYNEAAQLADRHLERYPNARNELLRLKLEALLGAHAFEEAIELASGLLAETSAVRDADNTWLLMAKGRAHQGLHELQPAKSTFQKVIELNPNQVEAYDCLARVERAMGAGREAQRLLAEALSVSPRSVRRHQALADVASANGDYTTAEKTYEKVLQMSEDSVYARPDDTTGLISAIQCTRGPDAALKSMGELLKRASRKRGAKPPHWRISTLESTLLGELGREQEAQAAVQRALEAFQGDTGRHPTEATLALVKRCYENGLGERARGIVDKLVRENHDSEEVGTAVQATFDALGLSDEGRKLIEAAQQAVIRINNEGVMLAKSGRYRDAVTQLQQAASELPHNFTVQINLLQALLLLMQEEGVTNQSHYLAREHLRMAERLAPRSEKIQQMKTRLQALVSAGVRPTGG